METQLNISCRLNKKRFSTLWIVKYVDGDDGTEISIARKLHIAVTNHRNFYSLSKKVVYWTSDS